MNKLCKNAKKQDFFGFKDQAKNYVQFRPNYPLKFIDQMLNSSSLQNTPRNNCLDIATGTGFVANRLSQRFKNVLGIDISEQQLQQAKEKFKDVKNLDFKHLSIEQYLDEYKKNKQEKIDLIIIAQALHWFQNIPEVLKNINSILSTNSRLAVVTYLQQEVYINDQQIQDQKNILVNKGFKVEDNLNALNFHDQDEEEIKNLIELKKLYDEFFDFIKPHFKFDRTVIDKYYEPLQLDKHLNIVEKLSYIDCYICLNIVGYLQSVSGYNCYLKDNNIQKGSKDDPLLKIQTFFEKIGQPPVYMITTYLAFIAEKYKTISLDIKKVVKLVYQQMKINKLREIANQQESEDDSISVWQFKKS